MDSPDWPRPLPIASSNVRNIRVRVWRGEGKKVCEMNFTHWTLLDHGLSREEIQCRTILNAVSDGQSR